jgi:uncharacterized protein YkwD
VIVTKEGFKAYDDAIAFLSEQKPLAALKWNDALTKAAEFHNTDTGPKGITGHSSSDGTNCFVRLKRYIGEKTGMAENISYGSKNGKLYVLGLVIDDGVLNRGHRTNIYNASLTDVGIALGPHAEYDQMLTMDFCITNPTKNTICSVIQISVA